MSAHIIFTVLLFFTLNLCGQNVHVALTNIRSVKGEIVLGIFRNQTEFESEKAFKQVKISKTALKNNSVSTTLSLNPGVYGISVLDDENGNGKMDYNILGIPKEGYGFSNYIHNGLTRPDISKFSFRVLPNKTLFINIQLQYF